MNILIVEDEDVQLVVYRDAIDDYNARNALKIAPTICRSYQEAEHALITPFFDAAIIDLKLSTSDELEGKKLIEYVYKKIRVPIFVYSGSLAQIDDLEENALFRKRLRTDQLDLIFKEISEIYSTGITSYLKPNGIIDKKLNEIFWSNLADDLDSWLAVKSSNALLRYILAYFQEYLEINIEGEFDDYSPKEVFLTPPIKTYIHTGELISIKGELFLVLTPACDIVLSYERDKAGNFKRDKAGEKILSRKADNMILAAVKEFQYDNLDKSKITEFVGNKNLRFHYLPPYKNESGFLIDFQEIRSERYEVPHVRIASISPAFIKDIISRFANYYSRQGQPTFNQSSIIEELAKKASMKKNQKEA